VIGEREHLRPALEAVLARHRASAFQWGVYDCATLWIECVEVVTGERPVRAGVRWRSKRGALAALRREGASSVDEYLERRFTGSTWLRPRVGDLAELLVAPRGRLTSPGVCLGSSVVFRSETGWHVHPADAMAKIWRVG
jgi:hypothetical protein